ncbi:MAG: S-layer homology domain-containing protein [Oscillospiraceae bacterium]|nr:S-layer homology domain-containing protein [Oscillospiraceae bacterium]
MKQTRKLVALATAVGLLLSLAAPALAATESGGDGDTHTIVLSSIENGDGTYTHTATYDGERVTEYDYTWSIDPSSVEDSAPAESYSGDEPGDEAVYIAHDIYYYPELDTSGFTLVNYDGEQEWAYYYTAAGYEDFIFSTLPYNGGTLPTSMMHSAAEAYENAVLHITQAGTYYIEGEWHGQIWIDLGDDASTDQDAKVTIILNGVDVTCTVAPALVFYSVYECDQDQTSASSVDTSQAGASVVIADGTENNFTGENVYRILKAQYKTNSTSVQKKFLKQDGAFYSYMTMEVGGGDEGTGVLNITAGFEGLDSDMHLTINGGNINISAQDDGVNTSEDGISVFTINDGSLHILAGLGADGGDGVDSNGYLVINGGTVVSMASPQSDSGLDSDSGSYINGGTVVALGSTMDGVEADDTSASSLVSVNLQFSSAQSADEAIIITDTSGNVVFAYDLDKDEVAGDSARSYQGAILSCEALTIGESYYIYVGGDVYGEETQGVYDASTVTGFSSDAKQQCYTGTGTSTTPGGDGGAPDSGDGSAPDSGDGGAPDSGDGSAPDSGDGGVPGGSGGGPGGSDTGAGFSLAASETASAETGSVTFTMSERVNSFSGVTDYDGGDSDADTNTDTNTDSNTGTDASGGFDSATWLYNSSADVYYQTGVVYCEDPYDTTYESFGVYVPAAYMNMTANGDGTYTFVSFTTAEVNGYTAETAPIVIPVNTAGYSAQAAPTGFSSGVTAYTDAGIIYLYAGCRGRDTTNGGAPWGVTDLKAAIRYYRANASVLPGDTDSIFTFGHSGGGAQSAVVGASGDSELYYPYLYAIGAAGIEYDEETGTYTSTVSDAVCGSMCWCPITSLDYADAAYEWMMGQYSSTGTRADSAWTSLLSDDLSEAFAEYINSLTLEDEDGNSLTLTDEGEGIYTSGSYYDYLLDQIEYSLNDFIDAYTDEDGNFTYSASSSGGPGTGGPDNSGFAMMASEDALEAYLLTLDENYGTDEAWIVYDEEADWYSITSVEDFVLYGSKSASKDVGAFDDLDGTQAENYVFGSGSNASAHFDAVMAGLLAENYAEYAAADASVSESDILAYAEAYQEDCDSYTSDSLLGYSSQYRQDMYNPMYYLCQDYDGYGTSTTASYWRINTGITQSDTSLTVEMNLYLSLLEDIEDGTVESVDFAMLWAQGHTTAERAGADSDECFIQWIAQCLASASADEDSGATEDGGSTDGETTHTHSYTAEVTTAATCGTDGVRTYTCSCGDSYTETIPATGEHTWDGGTVTLKATRYTTGVTTYTCTLCGATKTETVAVLTGSNAEFLFDDVSTETSSNSWYYKAVYWAYDLGVTTGTSTTWFSPGDSCTRAQFATFLYRLAKNTGADVSCTAENPFSDVVEGEIYADYYTAILWAYDSGITNGTSATTFSPDDTITRAQAVTMLYRYEKMVNGEPSVNGSSPFSDVIEGETYSDYYTAILWACEQEITNGNSDDGTRFDINVTCSRAMMVTFLYRYAE